MMDYLDWRGDIPFSVSGFNEVDNLLLSQLAYVKLDGIVPGRESDGEVRLGDASAAFWERHTEEEILSYVSMTKSSPFVMKKMAESERFGDTLLSRYVNDISDEEQSQFAVMCCRLPDGSIFISFSGTDNTIVGWRENFNMGFMETTPGQRKALAYLNEVAPLTGAGCIRVGGHSKGGNLAVYASVLCREDIGDRIAAVYSNDGPGFRKEFIESEEYLRMMPKIRTILPESSVFGMLLQHQESYEVVKSTLNGIQQHDATSWEVLGTSFVYAEEVAAQSVLLDETLKNWIFGLSGEEREQIVNAVFGILDEANIRTVDDFYNSTWKTLQEIMRARNELPEETQKLFSKALKLLWKAGAGARRASRPPRRRAADARA